ncbi:maleylpyruvate isomerase family mycothiol-dependent enzyme [Amycolatopsis nigrescens]|uniref:maleylpyruvate isomerase family mycothiol-dependent enzyme n=1 Tax=Amycolatopsis nigrescens TaxID=381445 RepID=UPI000683E38F|nr:maleylpyruvate isomerase family mycothiol-dependent enzyme [Amycolatopsis nigrescens]
MMSLAHEERADFVALLKSLSLQQWDEPTLCRGWRVRDLVAHVVSYDELDKRGVTARLVKGRFSPGRINDLGVAEYNTRTPDELIALMNDHLEPTGLRAAFGGMIALVDGLIHQQDIRRPLGLPRDIPPERLRRTLPAALVAPPIRAFWRARGLRLVATDLDWSTGSGPEVRGPAEAILMAVAGRGHAVGELTGDGQPKLAARMTG